MIGGTWNYSAFERNFFDTGWLGTMSQARVSPISLTARKVIGKTGVAVPLILSGSAILYHPATYAWSSVVTVPTQRHENGPGAGYETRRREALATRRGGGCRRSG